MTIQPTPFVMLRLLQDQYRTMGKMIEMLEGMLDHSAPDPFLSAGPSDLDVVPIPPPALKRKTGASARPPVLFMLDGQQIKTTERRVKLLRVLMGEPLTYDEMVKAGAVPTRDAAKQAVIDINASLARAGAARRIYSAAKPAQRIGARGGREPARFALLPWPPQTITETDQHQDGASKPRPCPAEPQGRLSAKASLDSDVGAAPAVIDERPPQSLQPVTADETGECASRSVGDGEEPAGAAPDLVKPSAKPDGGYSVDPEAQKDSVDRTGRRNGGVGRDGAAAAAETSPNPGHVVVSGQEKALNLWSSTSMTIAEIASFAKIQPISVRCAIDRARKSGDHRAVAPEERPQPKPAEPVVPRPQEVAAGDLIAVDVASRQIMTGRGSYQASGSNLARTLDMLRGGDMFGLDLIAKRCGWQSPDVARIALQHERARLQQHGLDLHLDKINARLREAS